MFSTDVAIPFFPWNIFDLLLIEFGDEEPMGMEGWLYLPSILVKNDIYYFKSKPVLCDTPAGESVSIKVNYVSRSFNVALQSSICFGVCLFCDFTTFICDIQYIFQ